MDLVALTLARLFILIPTLYVRVATALLTICEYTGGGGGGGGNLGVILIRVCEPIF